ncbi:hypothetical protein ACFXPW_31955, partial [Streptomyces goshikiensis]
VTVTPAGAAPWVTVTPAGTVPWVTVTPAGRTPRRDHPAPALPAGPCSLEGPVTHLPDAPRRRPHPRTDPAGPAEGLRGHAAALCAHAARLRLAAAELDWEGPEAEALRAEVSALASRCAAAANGLRLTAARLGPPTRPHRSAYEPC